MIKTFVLIMIISEQTMTGYGMTSVVSEFTNQSTCINVMEAVNKDVARKSYAQVISQGCYPLGDK